MPNYIPKALKRLQYQPQRRPQYSPHQHIPIKYGRKGEQQFAEQPDSSNPLTPAQKTHLQSVIGTLLYHGRSIDYSILPSLNTISSEQATPTVETQNKAQRVLDFVATHPLPYIRYHASDMILHVDSDAAYLVAPKARSRIAGFYYLSTLRSDDTAPPLNGGIHVECKTLRHVVASAAEAETAAVFHNAQVTIPIRRILRALNHPQPPAYLKTDNSTTNSFIHDNIHQKRSKSWDMRYYWLRDKKNSEIT